MDNLQVDKLFKDSYGERLVLSYTKPDYRIYDLKLGQVIAKISDK